MPVSPDARKRLVPPRPKRKRKPTPLADVLRRGPFRRQPRNEWTLR